MSKWIPLEKRPLTEDEKEHYRNIGVFNIDELDELGFFNCQLPDDGQEVLISHNGWVSVDTFVNDGDEGCYFEGVDIDDVDAWMSLPDPYKEVESTTKGVLKGIRAEITNLVKTYLSPSCQFSYVREEEVIEIIDNKLKEISNEN